MSKKIIVGFLLAFIFLSLAFHLVGINKIPPCLNADEAAYGYNSYSILKTGKDEYGAFMPSRLKSFEDYKLPLYSYLSVPFIALFGLTEFSTRFLNIMIGVAFVPLIYFMLKELFKKEPIALFGSFLISVSPWVHIMSRQAQEGVLATFFIALSVYFLARFIRHKTLITFLLTNASIFLATFSYHTGRLFLFFILAYEIYVLVRARKVLSKKFWVVSAIVIFLAVSIPLLVDVRYGANRVANLAFYKNAGLQLRLDEYLREHNFRLLHNKLTESVRSISSRYFEQISPEFFLIWGDKTWRFGYLNLSLITTIEYVFIFIGLYYLFKNKDTNRFLILFLLLFSPVGNALTWMDYSLIRTYFMIFPILIIVAYGLFYFFTGIKKSPWRFPIAAFLIGLFLFNLINSWDIYLFHYPKRMEVVRAWQCGYKELTDYVKTNYDNFDRFIITDRHGQPYIFLLFYLRTDPAMYQKQAKLSAPDQYGFGQIGHFDKFYFKFHYDPKLKKTVYIGYPEEFNGLPIKKNEIKKIQIRTEEIFWIYEVH